VNQNRELRFGSIYLDCVGRAAVPHGRCLAELKVAIEWVPNTWFTLRSDKEDQTLLKGFAQVLQFPPTLSYIDETGAFVAEWRRSDGEKRLQEVKGRPNFASVKTYKR
jgi:hypothetical protein